MDRTVPDLLRAGQPDSPALTAPGRPPLDYRGLLAQIDRTAGFLRGAGIGVGDRVAIILPNGPELATAFLSAAGCAAATDREILRFIAGRLAPYKVPAVLRVLDELPRGATGKVRRLGVARQLGLA